MGVGQGAGRVQVRCVRSFLVGGRRARRRQARGLGGERPAEAAGASGLGCARSGWWSPACRMANEAFSAATASRVSVPRSPPPRHESGFLGRVAEPSSPSHTWARPRPAPPSLPLRMPLAPSLAVHRGRVDPQVRFCLLCSVVVAAKRSALPSTGRDEAAGQMRRLYTVNCL